MRVIADLDVTASDTVVAEVAEWAALRTTSIFAAENNEDLPAKFEIRNLPHPQPGMSL